MCVFGGTGFGRDLQESWVNEIIMTTLMDTMGKVIKKRTSGSGYGYITYTHLRNGQHEKQGNKISMKKAYTFVEVCATLTWYPQWHFQKWL